MRDLCCHVSGFESRVLGTGVPSEGLGDAVSHNVYGSGGGFSPGLRQNLSAATFLLLRSRAEIWHFVFAPNPRSSQVARFLKRLRGTPTVQTIASPPLSFDQPEKLLFGDAVVAQSAWTKRCFEESYERIGKAPPRLYEIPPPAPELESPTAERQAQIRTSLGIDEGAPVFLYPGDLEVSRGAENVVRWAGAIAARVPGARVVVAYRDKTEKAREVATELADGAHPCLVFAREVPDIHALVATSRAVLFPVDDLYGKVDLPIILLEAFRMGTPVVALNAGPLASLVGGLLLEENEEKWVDAASKLVSDETFYRSRVEEGARAVEDIYAPWRIARQYEEIYKTLI